MSDGGKTLYAMALTRRGAQTAATLASALGATLALPERLAGDYANAEAFESPVADEIAARWERAEGFLLVMAAGIAVRSIAPLLQSKYSDPAVVALDQEGRFAIPLLSGHLGGANALAARAALALGGQEVITTATDVAGAPAIEVWAARNALALENPEAVARVNRALAEGEKIGFYLEPGLSQPAGLSEIAPWLAPTESADGFAALTGAKIAVSDRFPGPGACLALRPKTLAIGVGARRGADVEKLVTEVTAALRNAGWSEKSVAAVATIDIKKDEPAIKALAESLGVDLRIFPAETLKAISAPNPSERVLREVGTPGVAEPAAIAASNGGKLVVQKIAGGEWTLATARMEEKWG